LRAPPIHPYRRVVPQKYVPVDSVATLVHYRGPTTLPGSPPDTSGGDVVVCLHDAGSNGAIFSALSDELANGHSPIAYDQPGHGRSGSLDSLGSIDAMAAHARSFTAALGVDPPVLFGEGMGSDVALEVAISDPDWPRALVLAGGAGAHHPELDEEIDLLRRITTGRARREFDRTGYGPETPREVYGVAFSEWVKTDPRATLGDRTAQAAWTAQGRLDAVKCPVLVIVGEHEEDEYRSRAEALAAALPNGRTAVLSGAGRRGVIEQPATLATQMNDFLREVLS